MTGLERSLGILKGNTLDHPPFHPIIMRWAARYNNLKYSDFCIIPKVKCDAMINCASHFDIDWVTVMSDPWAEASAFGIEVSYPDDNLPIDVGGHLKDAFSGSRLRPFDPLSNMRCSNRLEEIRIFRERTDSDLFIVGWVEGPVAEYVDLRKASEASVDFLLEPGYVGDTMDIIIESAKKFISLQIDAGAHCIGIGDAFCSQIGPDLYGQFAFNRQKELVDHIHSAGAIAKLHICGNTGSILPLMIRTGADIIDIDHLVPTMETYSTLLAEHQCFSGKSDPVTVICNGNESDIFGSVSKDFAETGGKCIVSAGCEITPETTHRNMILFAEAARGLKTF